MPNRFQDHSLKRYFIWSGTTLAMILGAVLFQNCQKTGFNALLDQSEEAQLGGVNSTPPGPAPDAANLKFDPSVTKAGDVFYGLFNKLTITNGVVPEGQPGKAILVRSENKTYVYVAALGLMANQTYMSHVHTDTCANGAGGHYKKDATVTTADAANEIWLTLNADATGVATSRAEVPYAVSDTARSIVVHNLDGSKFYCADLGLVSPNSPLLSQWSGGNFETLSTTKPGTTAQGSATKVVLNNHMTGFHVSLSGLTPGLTYPIHVHTAACSTGGGGHFLIDSTAAAGQSNEVWMPITASSQGSGASDIWINQVTSTTEAGAQSIVVHDPTDGTKQLCADLVAERPPSNTIHGAWGLFQPLDSAIDRVTAQKDVLLPKNSQAGFSYTLNPNSAPTMSTYLWIMSVTAGTYHAHLHTRPCRLGAGGHYKLDPTVTATNENNESWLMFTSNDVDLYGAAQGTSPTVFRADAMSMVVHDPTDSSKLFCADLF